VASTAGFQPGPYMATYYASKAYVLHFTEAIAEETRKTGLKVSALCPGATKTEFFEVAKMKGLSLAEGKFTSMMSARKVAEIGYQGALKGKVVNISGIFNKILASSVRISPRVVVRKVAAFLNTKK
ncbi:MAG: SDR family NAD(P)-dependent oxidoreductase, partial [Leptospiraceae bacterium]|nr:SDR family NAD(P)-dependent oxidoreductase [Leptospiraceae bacterium]